MKYKTETGIILSSHNNGWYPQILKIVEGHPGFVEFEPEDVLTFHKDNPGKVWALAHTHPPQMYELSKRDSQTLRTWAWTISPYPMRMLTIAQVSDKVFRVTVYFGHLESKASWLARNKDAEKKDERQFEIIEEDSYTLNLEEDKLDPWENIIINKSYTED